MYIITLCLPRPLWAKPGKDTYFCLNCTRFTLQICLLQRKYLRIKYMCVLQICPFCSLLSAYVDIEAAVAVDEVVGHDLGAEACRLAVSECDEHLSQFAILHKQFYGVH